MKLKVIRGRNQQGISFLPNSMETANFVTLTSKHHSCISEIRQSKKVPEGTIVIDSRLWDVLNLSPNDVVSIENHEDIPKANILKLSAISTNPEVSSNEIVEDIKDRIDDFKKDLNGLVVKVGLRIQISRISAELIISDISPASSDGFAQIHWDNLMKLVISKGVDYSPFNICCVIDLGAACHTEDITNSLEDESKMIPRYRAVFPLLSAILQDLYKKSIKSLFSVILFSTKLEIFPTFDPVTGEQTYLSNIDSHDLVPTVESWILENIDSHRTEPSNPCIGLERGIELASTQEKINGYPSLVLFFSSGTYSEGANPVTCASLDSEENNIAIVTIGLGNRADYDLLKGIAEAGNGIHHRFDCLEEIPKIVKHLKEVSNMIQEA